MEFLEDCKETRKGILGFDHSNALNAAEITDKIGLRSLRQRHWYIQSTCATSGEGLYEGLEWLKATIVPRGVSLGIVALLPDKDETSISRKQMLARLHVCMGGRVAEEINFGENEVTSGASSDLQQPTNLGRAMVTKYGMSKQVGVVTRNYDNNGKSMSTKTRLLIEKGGEGASSKGL